jgi:uncharacterized protein (TIGR04255 family)
MAATMKRAPVFFTFAYLGFDEITSMSDKFMPAIQEALRPKGYTKFSEVEAKRVEIRSSPESIKPEIKLTEDNYFVFGDSLNRNAFVLSRRGLAFQTTKYEGHELFFKELLKGFSQVKDIVQFSNVTELSIRYFDAVIPDEGEDRANYLQTGSPSEMELDGNEGMTHLLTNRHSVFSTALQVSGTASTGKFSVGTNWFNGKIGLPPDVSVEGMDFPEDLRDIEDTKHIIVDFQHRVEIDLPYDEESAYELFLSLHSTMKKGFRNIFSDFAMRKWS